jgi:hypothetical protein
MRSASDIDFSLNPSYSKLKDETLIRFSFHPGYGGLKRKALGAQKSHGICHGFLGVARPQN